MPGIMRLAAAAAILSMGLAASATAEPLNAPQWRFSVNFPCQSQLSGQAVDTAVGRVVITIYACGDDNRGFFAGINDYPPGSIKPENRDNAYAGAVNGMASEVKGTIRSTTVYTLANIDGREVFIDIAEKKAVMRARAFLVGDRLYQTSCVGTAGSETAKDCVDYLNSFTLIAVDPLLKSDSTPPK